MELSPECVCVNLKPPTLFSSVYISTHVEGNNGCGVANDTFMFVFFSLSVSN